MKRLLLAIIISISCIPAFSQENAGTVDIFAGVDFRYRDIYMNNRIYDLLINVTPSVKWHPGHRWELAARVDIPVVNQFGASEKYVRLSIASISKQIAFGSRFKTKLTGGIFSRNTYGLDFKGMYIVKDWLALTARMGLVGYLSMAPDWVVGKMTEFNFQVDPEFYIPAYNTSISLSGGRYLYGDYGMRGELYRHFKHVSVGFYGSYSDRWREDAGFKVIVMIPPYKRSRHKVNFRPASNFRVTYSSNAQPYAVCTYNTEPEENERSGWFDHDLLPWGQSTMAPDFVDKTRKEVAQ